MKKILTIVCILVVLMLLTACSNNIVVTVNDMGQETVIETKTGITVSKLLEQQSIVLNAKDETEPSLSSEITEYTTEVIIKRYAKVTVKKGIDTEEVELVGATVQEAIDKTGFEVEDGEELNYDPDDYLRNGMIIKIEREITATLEVDGNTKDIKTKSVTVEELLNEQGVTLGDDDEVNEELDTLLKDKMKIVVNRVTYKEEIRTESIDYKTIEKYDDSMYEGESKVTQEGSKGEKEVTYKIKYVDGKESKKEKLNETIKKEPIDKIIVHGTKSKMLTESEAESIVKGYWGINGSSDNSIISVSDGLKSSNGKKYYAFRAMWRVDDGGGKFHYSTIDRKYVNAYTGEVLNDI